MKTHQPQPSKICFLKHIVRGCGALPHCGSHPGTGFLMMLALMGAMAGTRGGWLGAMLGAGAMLAFGGPIYLCGAYQRSKEEERAARKIH